jgi:hypothetical protein
MKRTTYLSIITGILAAGLLFRGCESVLFIELEEGVKLIVLNGALSSEESVAVQVSRTRHILDNAPVVPLEQATLKLYEDGNPVGDLVYSGNGYYTAPGFIPSVDRTYRVEVSNEGYPDANAQCVIPRAVPVTAFDTSTVTMEYGDEYYYYYYPNEQYYLQFDLSLEDPAGEDNYYLVSANVDRSTSNYLGDTTVRVLDSIFWNGQWYPDIRDSTYSLFDTVANSHYAVIISEDIVAEASTPDGVLFSDRLIDGKRYSFRGRIQYFDMESADSARVDFRLQSISEDYYRYLKTRQQQYDIRNNVLAVPVIVYSNVVDGTGILGGVSSDHRVITTFIPEYGRWYYEPW